MFQFPGLPPVAMYSHRIRAFCARVLSVKLPDSKGYYYLIWAYRKLLCVFHRSDSQGIQL